MPCAFAFHSHRIWIPVYGGTWAVSCGLDHTWLYLGTSQCTY